MTRQQLDDLRKRIEWWWDEAARCERIGAQLLAEFCRRQASVLQERLA